MQDNMKIEISKTDLEKVLKEYFDTKYGTSTMVNFIPAEEDREGDVSYANVTQKIKYGSIKTDVKQEISHDDLLKILGDIFGGKVYMIGLSDSIKLEIIKKKNKKEEIIMKKELKEIEELLVVIDMVNGFVKEGALAAPSIMRVVPRQQELLEEYEKKENGANVIVRDVHDDDSVEFKTFGKHCIKGTNEELLIEELEKYHENAFDFEKNSTNFMLAPGVIPFFEKMIKLEKVAFVGCLSEVCVKNAAITARNYFDQTNRNVEVLVYADGIDTFDAPGHNADTVTKNAILDMEANGVKIYRK